MRHLIKSGTFRADRAVERICHNDPGSFQFFFHGFFTADDFIFLAEESFCDLQRAEKLNFFSTLLLYGCCQGAHGNRFPDEGDVRNREKRIRSVDRFVDRFQIVS